MRNVKTAKDARGVIRCKYRRVCKCGDEKWVSYKPKATALCIKCSGARAGANLAKINSKPDADKKVYIYFCPFCPSIRSYSIKRKGALCGACSRKYSKQMKRQPRYIYFDMESMMTIAPPKIRHFRICPDCPEDDNTKQVNCASKGGIKRCPKHRFTNPTEPKKAPEPRTHKKNIVVKAGYNKQLKAKDKKVSAQAIEREKIKNREHREKVADTSKVITQTKSEEQMMKEYLETHTVKTVGDTRPIEEVHFISGNGIVGTSVLS